MAVTHVTTLRNTLADAAVDSLDVGSTDATGDIQFATSADAVLGTGTLTNPAFGASAGGTATAAAIGDTTIGTAGTIAKAFFRNRNNSEQFRCAVATSASDINLSSLVVAIGDIVRITALTYSAPA